MLKGIIFVKESIISLDLKTALSQHYEIVNVFKNVEQATLKISGIDFIIIDTDPYSEQELRSILKKLNVNQKVKIISITSQSEPMSYSGNHKPLKKPFMVEEVINAINRERMI